jgi:hypothetical protein
MGNFKIVVQGEYFPHVEIFECVYMYVWLNVTPACIGYMYFQLVLFVLCSMCLISSLCAKSE